MCLYSSFSANGRAQFFKQYADLCTQMSEAETKIPQILATYNRLKGLLFSYAVFMINVLKQSLYKSLLLVRFLIPGPASSPKCPVHFHHQAKQLSTETLYVRY